MDMKNSPTVCTNVPKSPSPYWEPSCFPSTEQSDIFETEKIPRWTRSDQKYSLTSQCQSFLHLSLIPLILNTVLVKRSKELRTDKKFRFCEMNSYWFLKAQPAANGKINS